MNICTHTCVNAWIKVNRSINQIEIETLSNSCLSSSYTTDRKVGNLELWWIMYLMQSVICPWKYLSDPFCLFGDCCTGYNLKYICVNYGCCDPQISLFGSRSRRTFWWGVAEDARRLCQWHEGWGLASANSEPLNSIWVSSNDLNQRPP